MSGFSINYRFYGFILIKEPQITQIALIKFQDAQAHELTRIGLAKGKIREIRGDYKNRRLRRLR